MLQIGKKTGKRTILYRKSLDFYLTGVYNTMM